jgi:hypothetical protein
MGAIELLTQLTHKGFNIRLDGNTIYVSPASKVTADMAEQIRQYKGELLQLLQEQPGFIPIATFPDDGEMFIRQCRAITEAQQYEAKEWAAMVKAATTGEQRDHLNAMAHLKQAIDKGKQADIERWAYTAACANKEAI